MKIEFIIFKLLKLLYMIIFQTICRYLKNVIKTTGRIESSAKHKGNHRAEVIVLLNTYNDLQLDSRPHIMVNDISVKRSIQSNYLMEYWKGYTQFLELQKLTQKVLFVPSSSASSERTCSTAAYLISNKRSRLSAEHAKKIIFVSRNKHFMEV